MVPCLVNRSCNHFTPLSNPHSKEIDWEKIHTRQPWLPLEDERLKKIAEQRNKKNWSKIAKELNAEVHKGLPIRLGKQCRERYFNHLDPCLNKGKWDQAEDVLIIKKQQSIGNRWSEIARFLPGRTENQIKNRFKSLVKKTPKGVDTLAMVSGEVEEIRVCTVTQIRDGVEAEAEATGQAHG